MICAQALWCANDQCLEGGAGIYCNAQEVEDLINTFINKKVQVCQFLNCPLDADRVFQAYRILVVAQFQVSHDNKVVCAFKEGVYVDMLGEVKGHLKNLLDLMSENRDRLSTDHQRKLDEHVSDLSAQKEKIEQCQKKCTDSQSKIADVVVRWLKA